MDNIYDAESVNYDSSDDEALHIEKNDPLYNVLHMQMHKRVLDYKKRWHMRFPQAHFTRFVREGLLPFLSAHGYKVRVPFHSLVQQLFTWAFCVMRIVTTDDDKYLHYKTPSHGGNLEDFIWFSDMIDNDDMSALLDTWQFRQFFDYTPIGYKQRYEFINFLWTVVDLADSKGHVWAREEENEDGEEDAKKGSGADILKQAFDKHGF
jgi:hypothetical protein